MHTANVCICQLILRSEMRYYAKGSIVADSREEAKGLMVITSGQVALMKNSDENWIWSGLKYVTMI